MGRQIELGDGVSDKLWHKEGAFRVLEDSSISFIPNLPPDCENDTCIDLLLVFWLYTIYRIQPVLNSCLELCTRQYMQVVVIE
jgi:hypothetical protein